MAKGVEFKLNGETFDKKAVIERARAALVTVTGRLYDKKELQELEVKFGNEWRETWQPNDDVSFYATPEYAWLTLLCWQTWSGSTLGNLEKFALRTGFSPASVLDFGAGIGLTTLQLASMFPDAKITYANIPCVQASVAAVLFADFGVCNISSVAPDDLKSMHHDAVVAVEVMEHIRDPGAALRSIVDSTTCAYVDASTFSVDMAGHYETYSFGGTNVPRRKARRRFNKVIREDLGFKPSWHMLKGDFRMFQGVPTVYLRPAAIQTSFKAQFCD